MANPEHVQIVKQGEEKLLAWRQKNPSEKLDLREADLCGADLHEADPRKATDRVATGLQLVEQLAGLGAAVAWRAFQLREALFQDRRLLRVGPANFLDDL